MQRGPIVRIITEETWDYDATSTGAWHHIRWSFETHRGRPTTAGVYHVPDAEWSMLAALMKEVSRRAVHSSPMSLVNYINGVAASAAWSSLP